MKMVECSFFLTIFCCIFSNGKGNEIEKADILLPKISNFVQFNNNKHLIHCTVKYNNESMKI